VNRFSRCAVIATVLLTAGLLLPDSADAQRGGRGPGGRQGGGMRGGGRAVAARPVYRPVVRGGPVFARRGFVGAPYGWGGGWGWGGASYWGSPYYGIGGPFWWPMSYGWWGSPVGFYGVPYGRNTSDARLQVTPRETEVYIDGALAGLADQYDGRFQSLRLAPGTHEITLYLEGHRRFTQHIYVAPASTLKLRHAMQPLAAGDSADPRPTPPPPPAPRLDGDDDRDDPTGPPPPDREWRAPRERGLPREGRAPRDREPRRSAPADAARAGTLIIRVQPADAEILIDGQRWQSPESDRPFEVQIPAGRVRVEVRKPGHVPFVTAVMVRPGDVSTLNVSLPAAGNPL